LGGGRPMNRRDLRDARPSGEGGTKNPFDDPGLTTDDPESAMGSGRKTNPSGEDVNPEDELPPVRKTVDARKPVPSEADRLAAEKNVREFYALKKAAAKSAVEKVALSDRIWAQAVDSKDNAAAQYALFSIAFQLICESGRLEKAVRRAESFADVFEVDSWELKVQAIASAAKAVQAALASHSNPLKLDGDEIVLISRQFADEALDAGEIDAAQKAIKAIIPLAKSDAVLMRDVNILRGKIERQATRYRPVGIALERLKEKPDDGDAIAVVGRWTCFETHDWDHGLPMLAKSSDAALAELAAKDLAAAKKDASEQLAAADAWWDYAQKEKDKSAMKASALSRAEYWYDRALPDLSGLEKVKADGRLKSISGIDLSTAPGHGVVQAGNVALAKNGTRVEGVRYNADKLLDGDSKTPSWDGDAANSPAPTPANPCEWTITFDKVYQLQQIRFHFYDGDARFYHYAIAVSADGVNYKPLVEHNQGQWFRWQVIPMPAQSVKSIKLFGTFSYRNRPFSVSEFEAYCIPPKQ
jgi:hypothetical protein